MTVHLAGTAPAENMNGLVSIESQLIEGRYRGTKYLVVGVVKVTGAKETDKEGFKVNPIVSFTRIEAIPDEMQADALRLLDGAYEARHGGTTLEFPDDEDQEPPAPLELEASSGEYQFVVVDTEPGKFTLQVLAPSGALAIERHALPRSVYGEIPPGTYQLVYLGDEDLHDLATSLVADYEGGFTSEDLVDAEVIDDDEVDES